ncbi:hypothetical protein [Agarilytica rhodophyticola]|uniref:hypothetical protein n=1 Tax=Agarilytica rhodophyticola TaxID=1737490 RepID=UPI000B347F3C|nr:hypothetical protein [Agarilytica rhodophyticola]
MKRIIFVIIYSIFSLLVSTPIHALNLSSGDTISGYLFSEHSHSHSFIGNAGETVTLIVDEAVSSAGQISLHHPNEAYWTYANNYIIATLPDTGTYTVIVNYSSIHQSGPYSLSYSAALP